MTSEEKYKGEGKTRYEIGLLKDLRSSVMSIDSKVEEILDELKDHFEDLRHYEDEAKRNDLYDNNNENYEF